jgi:hypothetical protein
MRHLFIENSMICPKTVYFFDYFFGDFFVLNIWFFLLLWLFLTIKSFNGFKNKNYKLQNYNLENILIESMV